MSGECSVGGNHKDGKYGTCFLKSSLEWTYNLKMILPMKVLPVLYPWISTMQYSLSGYSL